MSPPLLALLVACGATPSQVTIFRARAERPPVHVEWSLGGTHGRWGAETLGRVAVVAEATLYQAAIPVGPLGAPPAVADVPVRERWTFQVSIREDQAGEAILCMADGECETLVATGTPEAIGASLGVAALDVMGLLQPQLPCLAGPPSRDPYATLLVGRSAATAYGVLPAPEVPGDRQSDPIAKAIFLDPRAATAQWLAGRDAWRRGEVGQAEAHFGLASPTCATHLGWAADHALSVGLARRRMRSFPDDPRFLVAHADAGLVTRDRSTLDTLDRALAIWPGEAPLARRAADAAGPDQLDARLEAWARVDPADPEPVHRQSRRAIEAQDWTKLLAHAQELERRGSGSAELLTPALLALGRVDAAARAAPPAWEARVGARAGAAVLGESPEELLLAASRSIGSDPARALVAARQALAARPDWPEALAVAAEAAAAASIDPSPYRQRLAEVEP